MKKKFRDLLHRFKVESFKTSHNHETDEELGREIKRFTEHALNDAFHFHFQKDPSPERLETFTMIKNYTLQSLMPPVIEKIMQRVVTVERQHRLMVKMLDELLEILSHEEHPTGARDAV
ncbi:MAG: hypothetical protein HZB39_03440 [Planctomycetes bacterium]|nr:hypothetical protein [Planctomycetota bacterium]